MTQENLVLDWSLLPATVDDHRSHNSPEIIVALDIPCSTRCVRQFRVIRSAGGVGFVFGLIEKLLQLGVAVPVVLALVVRCAQVAKGNQSQGGQPQAADLIHSRSGCCSLNVTIQHPRLPVTLS